MVTAVAFVLSLAFAWIEPTWVASADNPWGPMSEIEKAARKEGKLVVYAAPGHADGETQRAIGQHFKEKYAITIDWTSLSARDISPRVIAEQRTKQYVVDVVMSGIAGNYTELKPRGHVVPILAPSSLEKGVWRLDPATAVPKDRDWLFLFVPLTPGFYVNTNLLKPGEEPKSYQELLNPKWKGKIVLQTPATGGTGSGWFRATYKTLGLDYMRALARQVTLVPNVNDPPDAVARGQYPVAIAPNPSRSTELVREGAPVKFIHPKEGSHLFVLGTSFVANAPHPNTAKLFFQWFYTKEGQAIYAKGNKVIPLRKDVGQDHLPPDLRSVEGAPVMMPEAEDFGAEKSQELTKLGKQIFEERK
jgi:iron(III) transport system substrate-binding protein